MTNFPILDLVIGIIFIYFLLSIICSSSVELWFALLDTRAKLLEKWLKQIFDLQALDSNGNLKKTEGGQPISLGQEIMDHCMVTALSETGKSTSYIKSANFVSALLDKITLVPATGAAPSTTTQLPPVDLPGYITAIQNSTVISGELKRTILSFAHQAQRTAEALNTIPAVAHVTNNITTTVKSSFDLFRESLEKWYESNADRISGTLKRKKSMPATIIIGLLFTVGLNIDSISICKYLYSHPEVSKEFANKAISDYKNLDSRVKILNEKKDSIQNNSDSLNALTKQLNGVKTDVQNLAKALPPQLPLGWDTNMPSFSYLTVLGWLVTILAISLGAPFWFDMLNKISNLRGTGPKPLPSGKPDEKK